MSLGEVYGGAVGGVNVLFQKSAPTEDSDARWVARVTAQCAILGVVGLDRAEPRRTVAGFQVVPPFGTRARRDGVGKWTTSTGVSPATNC